MMMMPITRISGHIKFSHFSAFNIIPNFSSANHKHPQKMSTAHRVQERKEEQENTECKRSQRRTTKGKEESGLL